MKFFIADLHFDHEKIASHRKFSSVGEMNSYIINIWNQTVKPQDEVHILGDFFLGKKEDLIPLLNKLNGKLILTKGNHDTNFTVKTFEEKFKVKVRDIRETSINVKDKKYKLVLCHFPIQYWNRMRNYIHLHGHMHDEKILYIKNRLCVSWEVAKKPLSEQEIIERCQSLEPIT